MDRTQTGGKADLIFNIGWKSENARHMDCYHARDVNFWRDILPAALKTELNHGRTGERFELRSAPGETIPKFNQRKLIKVKERQFERFPDPGIRIEPRNGRFYPKGLLRDVAGIFKVNREPFRCVNLDGDYLDADFNHPLASRDLDLSVIVSNVTGRSAERGGRCIDWMETVSAGPGMQARWQDKETDFFSGRPFKRDDEETDALFYAKPRFTRHLDDTAIEVVRNIHGRLLKDGMCVLDLMSSWETYIPASSKPRELVGLGMNAKELQRNERLDRFDVHDLNTDPMMPFASGSFDAVICNVSVEYLIDPFAVFAEAARVLRPGGYLITTFSNRYFPPKAVRIWKELHDFERMGLVLEYFGNKGLFKNLQTYSMRGLPRPQGDKYFPQLRMSDPVFAVWGQKSNGSMHFEH